jgi:hypothetical protein
LQARLGIFLKPFGEAFGLVGRQALDDGALDLLQTFARFTFALKGRFRRLQTP